MMDQVAWDGSEENRSALSNKRTVGFKTKRLRFKDQIFPANLPLYRSGIPDR